MENFLSTGCLPDLPDERDTIFENEFLSSSTSNLSHITLNKRCDYDLRNEYMPKIYNQLQYGSCVANAVLRAYEYSLNKLYGKLGVLPIMGGKSDGKFSRQFLYYMARLLSGTVKTDGGAYPRSGCKALKKWGVCTENRHPYETGCLPQPSADAVIYADDNKITKYYRITTFDGIIEALKNEIPVLVSTNVFQFDDAGTLNGLSKKFLSVNSKTQINHEMLICGIKTMQYFDHEEDCFIIANSWGENWGDKGYCYVPARRMMDYNIGDLWVIIVDQSITKEDDPVDEPTINKKTLADLPEGTIVVDNEAYSKTYVRKIAEHDNVAHGEFIATINKKLEKLFIKNDKGEFINPLGFTFVKPDELIYHNDNGDLEYIS